MKRMVLSSGLAAALLLGAGALASADTLSGSIARVDASAKSFAVKVNKKVERFSLGPNAVVMRGTTAIQLGDVKPREQAKVEFTLDHGKRVASRVDVTEATAAAKPSKASARSTPAKAPAH